jgi:hypothetical protein
VFANNSSKLLNKIIINNTMKINVPPLLTFLDQNYLLNLLCELKYFDILM